jgi:iron complex outermembrane recepter protein
MRKETLIAGIAFSVFAAPAFAQDSQEAVAASSSDQEGTGLQDIIVTARRRAENVQSVPVAVIVASGEELTRRGITSLADLGRIAPSLGTQGSSGRTLTPALGIRGQRFNDTLIGSDPAVAIYSDEVVLTPSQGSNLGLYDLQSVQVLKGPQGTLFGRNTTGGALLFTTNKPTDTLSGALTARVGNYGTFGLTGFLNLPLTDTLRVRVAGNYDRHDGYSKVIAGPRAGAELNDLDAKSVRGIVDWEPSSTFKNTLIVSVDSAYTGGAANVLTGVNAASAVGFYNNDVIGNIFSALARQQARSPYELEGDQPNFERVRALMVSNITTLDLGDVTLKNIFGYRRLKYDLAYEGDDAPFPLFAVGPSSPTRTKQYSEELQLSGTAFGGRTKWVVGGYYYLLDGSDLSGTTVYTAINPNSPLFSGGLARNESFSAYLQQTSEIFPRLSLTTGIRYSVDRREGTSIAYNLPTAVNANQCNEFDANGNRLPQSACFQTVSTSFAKPTWTISLDYKLGENQLIYLATRRGYRSGGFNLRGTSPTELRPFRPEIVTDGEVGFKLDTRPFGMSLRTNFAAYFQKYKDIQKVTSVNTPAGVSSSIFNAASAEIFGLEFESTLVPVRGLNIQLAYSYTRPKYTSFTTAQGDFKDNGFAYISTHQFTGAVTYTFQPTPTFGDVSLHVDYSYQSGFHTTDLFQSGAQVRRSLNLSPAAAALVPDELPGEYIKGYGLFNARIDWMNIAGSKFSAAVFARNLFDKRTPNGGLSLYESVGLIFNTYTDPRIVGLEASYRF